MSLSDAAAGQEAPIEILHRDAHLLVVKKPAGLPTTAPDAQESLVRRVRALDPKAPRLHPTSRLDAEVSGIVTFARTPEANRWVLEARRAGNYVRRYLALAVGVPVPDRGVWESTLAIDPQQPRRRMVVSEGKRVDPALRPRIARSRYRLRAHAEPVALLDVWPETGRTHQIRVQVAAAGCPLWGDVHYGGPRRVVKQDGRVLRAQRVMLHCAEIRIPDLVRGDPLIIVTDPPADMARLWYAAGGATTAWSVEWS